MAATSLRQEAIGEVRDEYPSYENADGPCDPVQHGACAVTWGSVEAVAAWPLAGELLEMLGDEYEVDASFFENSWTCGLSPAGQKHRCRREQRAAEPTRGCSLAELDRLSGWSWTQAPVEAEKPLQIASFVAPATSYRAEWLQGFSEEKDAGFTDPAKVGGSTVSSNAVDELGMMHPMTQERACRLLHLSAGSAGAQIKAAYRRLVNQCHPDRFEGENAFERTRVNERMAAINEAYRMVRSAVSNV